MVGDPVDDARAAISVATATVDRIFENSQANGAEKFFVDWINESDCVVAHCYKLDSACEFEQIE